MACYKRRQKRHEVHENAKERLSTETDIVQIVELLRQSLFLTRIALKRHQKKLIPSFRYYNLNDHNLIEPHFLKPPSDIFSVLSKFEPGEDEVDRRILYEITGTKISGDKFADSSDDNEEDREDKATKAIAKVNLSDSGDQEESMIKKKPKSKVVDYSNPNMYLNMDKRGWGRTNKRHN